MTRSQEGRREQVNADIPFGSAFLELQKFIHRWITEFLVLKFRDSTNVPHAMAGEELQPLVGHWPALTAEFHQGAFAACKRLGRRRRGCQRHARGRGKDERSAIHGM